MSRKHPLSDNPGWKFVQYSVGLRAPIQTVPLKGGGKGRKIYINASTACREGVVGDVRNRLRNCLGRDQSVDNSSWMTRYVPHSRAVLDSDALRAPGESFLQVTKGHITENHRKPNPKAGRLLPRPPWWSTQFRQRHKWGDSKSHRQPEFVNGRLQLTKSRARDFIWFCDAIIGPITVLLNPDRFEGNWWETSVEEAMGEKGRACLRWYGIDNTALAHPALVSLYTGLARQCAFFVRCDMKDEILKDVDRKELRACLTHSDPEAALKIARSMKKWIEVPSPTHGRTSNVPVPMGSFAKIPALHKAIYGHGFDKTFGHRFIEGWALKSGIYGTACRGIHSFMGVQGNNQNGQRIKKLAKQ